MKNYLSLFIIFVIVIFASATHAIITFEKWYGGTNTDRGYSVIQTSDGGYIIAGETWSFGAGSGDVYLVKTDSLGDTIWTKTFGDTAFDCGLSVASTFDNAYIVTGFTESFTPIWADVYFIKTDPFGDTVWTKTYGGTDWDAGYSVAQTSDGGYILTGDTYCFIGGSWSWNIYLIKTDSLGDSLWIKILGGTDDDYGRSVAPTFDGGYIITGSTCSFGAGSKDLYLIKTDSLGDTIWTKTYGDTADERGWSIAQTSDRGYIITGSAGAAYSDVYLIKTDSLGDTTWIKTYGGSVNEHGKSVKQTSDGGYIIAGVTTSFGAGSYDVYLIKTDSLGDTVWTKTYGGTDGDAGYSIAQTFDGGYIVTGLTGSFGAGLSDVYLIKTDSLGDVGVEESENPQLENRNLKLTLYPNPFTTQFSLNCSGISEKQKVTLEIYDVSGRLVKSVPLTTNHLSLGTVLIPGIYFLKADGVNVGKVVKVK